MELLHSLPEVVSNVLPPFPYPGLRPFQSIQGIDEATVFFGREESTKGILDRLADWHFVAVLGPSGIGKSSIVRAGVLPNLQAGNVYRAGPFWKTAVFRPGNNPIRALAQSLIDVIGGASDIGNSRDIAAIDGFLRRGSNSLVAFRREFGADIGDDINLLIVVDQFEELFRSELADQHQSETFVQLLLEVYYSQPEKMFVIVTMRTDFLEACTTFLNLPEALNNSLFLVPRMTPSEVRSSIVEPARLFGAEIDPGLVEHLVDLMSSGADYDPDQLPLMAHALMWLWREYGSVRLDSYRRSLPSRSVTDPEKHGFRRRPVVISLSDFVNYGGLSGILSKHAEDLFLCLSAEQQYIASKMFPLLSVLDTSGRYQRRSTSACEIKTCLTEHGTLEREGELSEIRKVIHVFTRDQDKLFVPLSETQDGNIIVDVSHECLIRKWPRLRQAAEEEADKIKRFRELAAAAEAWVENKRSRDFLKTGRQLSFYRAWWKQNKITPAWVARYKSPDESVGKVSYKFKLVAEYLNQSYFWFLAKRVGWGLLAATILAIIIVQQSISSARLNRELQALKSADRGRTLAQQSEDALFERGTPTTALLIALEALSGAAGSQYVPEAEAAAYSALERLHNTRIFQGLSTASYARDGSLLMMGDDHKIHWLKADGSWGQPISIPEDAGQAWNAVFNVDGHELIINNSRLVPIVVDLDGSPYKYTLLKADSQPGFGAFSSNGEWIVTSSWSINIPVRLWDAKPPHKFITDVGDGSLGAITSDGRMIVTALASSRQLALYPLVQSGTSVQVQQAQKQNIPQKGEISLIIANPVQANQIFFVAEGVGVLWDLTDPAKNHEFTNAFGQVRGAAFSWDGEYLALDTTQGSTRVYETRNPGKIPIVLFGQQGKQWPSVTFGPGSKSLATGTGTGGTNSVFLWNMDSLLFQDMNHENKTDSLDCTLVTSEVKRYDLSANGNPVIEIGKTEGAHSTFRLPAEVGTPEALYVPHEGDRVILVPRQGALRVFDLRFPDTAIATLELPLVPQRQAHWESVTVYSGPPCVRGVTSRATESQTTYVWRYFSSSEELRAFAKAHIPWTAEREAKPKRVELDEVDRCKLGLGTAGQCANIQTIK